MANKREPNENEKKQLREIREPPHQRHGDLDAALIGADKTLEDPTAPPDPFAAQLAARDQGGEMLEIGQAYVFFTPAITLVGRVVALTAWEIAIESASWVADLGRYHVTFRQGFSREHNCEIEPCSDDPKTRVVISRGAVIYSVPFKHELPVKDAI